MYCWLGLNKNMTPSQDEPYYEQTHGHMPDKGHSTEVMAIVKVIVVGVAMIRAQTLGVSTANTPIVTPTLGVVNELAFDDQPGCRPVEVVWDTC